MPGTPKCAWCGYGETQAGLDKVQCLHCSLSTSFTGERVLTDAQIEKGLTLDDIQVPDPYDTGQGVIKQDALDRIEQERVDKLTEQYRVTDEGQLINNPQSQPAGLVPDEPPTGPTVDTSPTKNTPQGTTPEAGTDEADQADADAEANADADTKAKK